MTEGSGSLKTSSQRRRKSKERTIKKERYFPRGGEVRGKEDRRARCTSGRLKVQITS